MTTLPIHITAQGRAALVNATHTGTAPVTIASVGVTETWFDPSTDPPALPGQLKTLSTIAGTVVAADVIHVTLRDDSADAYDLRGFGLYLDDGTLFAVHAQPDVILAKTASTMLLLSADIQLADIDAASITFGDASFANPPASETVSGVLRLATDAQAIAGTDRTRAVPPGALKAALDARLGPAAPSSFIKGLLSLATAAALRAALSIKSAALKDEGAGKGLDADTVDGRHAAEFAAAAHTHGWTDIIGTPTAFPPAAHTHGWTDITGTPTAFPPAAHTHAAADIISGTLNADRIPTLAISKVAGLQGALDGKANSDHTHSASDITSGTLSDARLPSTMHGKTFLDSCTIKGGLALGSQAIYLYEKSSDGSLGVRVGPEGGPHGWFSFNADGRFVVPNNGASFGGTVYASYVTASGFSVASSRKLKRDIRPLHVDADIVDRFQPVTFRYKAAPEREVAGLIREDVADIFPLACTEDGIDYGQLVPLLIATIQHDRAQLRDLAARVAALEHRSNA
ncbi:tail fiber domain-containing protein [Pseudoxanthomonas taiwanensis]|uniref:Peptidase S74 domain-containing protein n=1 Tax=Pseudoxanthomonas taiwanensis TaxID=176598 RepID=A0A921TF74_9GAMM|nr:tail fiber domain-containing protein [Pseudoxanthomonas taiwanensis]KAF1690914.1 hypothetical protein CR938_00080 [Pseudoxanthomonas taiwanensis]